MAVGCLQAHGNTEKQGRAVELAPEFFKSNLDHWVDETCLEVSTKLPDYMVPSIWVVLEHIPMLISGKIDREAVIAWVESMDDSTYSLCSRRIGQRQTSSVKFRPEALIYNMRLAWGAILNVLVEDIGPRTPFMSLGRDSISAIQLVARCREIGISITVRDILKCKTLLIL